MLYKILKRTFRYIFNELINDLVMKTAARFLFTLTFYVICYFTLTLIGFHRFSLGLNYFFLEMGYPWLQCEGVIAVNILAAFGRLKIFP